MVGEVIAMIRPEIVRAKVIKQVVGRRKTQVAAATELSLSVRQIKRLCSSYRLDGPCGLVSRKPGKPSNHQLPAGVKTKALQRIRKHYPDFGPTLASEKLAERDGIELSNESVRQIMIADGLWKPRRRRHSSDEPSINSVTTPRALKRRPVIPPHDTRGAN
jgi:hypothetical protein